MNQVTSNRTPAPNVMIPQAGVEEGFASGSGFTMRRESGNSPNGNPFTDKWVLRDADGQFVDFDQYRHDLLERNALKTHY